MYKNLLNYEFADQKGVNSTCLVIGGSPFYTGAPYFSALTAFKMGFDLVYIMTTSNCDNTPLKTLLPEAVVTQLQTSAWIINRINICLSDRD